MKYLKTFKENFNFEQPPIIDLQEFLPNYQEPKYWRVERKIQIEDKNKGVVPPDKSKIILYWKVEKISDKEYTLISQNLTNNNKISNHVLEENLIELVLKIDPTDEPKISPLTPEEIKDFELNIDAKKFNI